MKTILLVFLLDLLNPNEPARVIHKAFESPAACERAATNNVNNVPVVKGVKMNQFCVVAADLTDED
jgi:hypothetical protein